MAVQGDDGKVDDQSRYHLHDTPDAIEGFVASGHPRTIKTNSEVHDIGCVDGGVKFLMHTANSLCSLADNVIRHLHVHSSDDLHVTVVRRMTGMSKYRQNFTSLACLTPMSIVAETADLTTTCDLESAIVSDVFVELFTSPQLVQTHFKQHTIDQLTTRMVAEHFLQDLHGINSTSAGSMAVRISNVEVSSVSSSVGKCDIPISFRTFT